MQNTLEGPLSVDCVFCVAVPKSYSKKDRENALNGVTWPRPDCDNYAKAILDAMTTVGAWQDDSQVVQLNVSKRYAVRDEIRVRVRVLASAQCHPACSPAVQEYAQAGSA